MTETLDRTGASGPEKAGAAATPLFEVALARRSAVITATCERRTRLLFVQKGFLEMISAPENRQFFQKLLATTELVKPRKLQKALKSFGEDSTLYFPQYLYECGYLEKEPALEFFRGYARQELFRIITETGWTVRVEPGRIDLAPLAQRIEDWRFHLELEPLVIEAARQLGADAIFEGVFPSDRDVLMSAAPSAGEGAAGAETDARRREIRALVDGTRDLGEIISAAATGRFETLLAVFRLEREGIVRRASASELLALAERFQKSGRIDKCQKLLIRAQELGADKPDLPLQIARNYELTGAGGLAVEQYLGHAERCLAVGRDEEAVHCLRRVVSLRPDEIRARQGLIELLDRLGQVEEMSAEYRALAQLHVSLGDTAKAAETLERAVEVGHFGDEVLAELANLWSALPADAGLRALAAVLARFRALAGRFLARGRRADAIRVLEFALTEQGFDPDAMVTLATTLEAEGKAEEAAESYETVCERLLCGEASLSGGEPATAAVLESLLRLRPEKPEVRRALADMYRSLGDTPKAIAHLRVLEHQQSDAGDSVRLSRTLESLVELEPEVESHRVALAESYLAEERTHLALRTLLDVALARNASGDAPGAREAAERVLRVEPLHAGAHRLLLDLDRAAGRRLEATLRLRLLADLCRLRAEYDEAERLSLELWRDHPDDPRLLLGLADIYEARADRKKLEGALAELLRQSLKAHNVGFACQTAERLQRVNPQNPILREASPRLESIAARTDEEEIARRVREIEATLERQVRARLLEEMARREAAPPAPLGAAPSQPARPAPARAFEPAAVRPIPPVAPAPQAEPLEIEPVREVAVAEAPAEELFPAPAAEESPWSTVKVVPESIHGIVEKLRSVRGGDA